MKYWENIANFIFIPVPTFLDSLCGSSHPPEKAYALTTLCSCPRNSSPAPNCATSAEHVLGPLIPAKQGWEAAQAIGELPIFSFSVCGFAQSGCCPLRDHLWGTVWGKVISREDIQGAPNQFRSAESNWDYSKGSMTEAAKPLGVCIQQPAVLPQRGFCSEITSVPHTASPISLGIASGSSVAYSCWDSSTHCNQTWSWCTAAHGGEFGKITQMCDTNHCKSLIHRLW